MINPDDAQTIAAIASQFMVDGRYSDWYDREKDGRSGTPGIWADLGLVGAKVARAEHALGVDWGEYEYIETIDSIVDEMYENGLEQDWTAVLRGILESQKGG